MQLMTLIAEGADNAQIEDSIKKEASLVLSLIKLVNTAGMGVTKNISSMGDVLMILGRNQLQRWLQILLYTEARGSHVASPLLTLATARGKFLELVAVKRWPINKSIADIGFTVGILSLLDTLLCQPMERILDRIKLGTDINEALLCRKGFYGDLLTLCEYMEQPEEAAQEMASLLARIGLSAEDLYALQLQAFEGQNNILHRLAG